MLIEPFCYWLSGNPVQQKMDIEPLAAASWQKQRIARDKSWKRRIGGNRPRNEAEDKREDLATLITEWSPPEPGVATELFLRYVSRETRGNRWRRFALWWSKWTSWGHRNGSMTKVTVSCAVRRLLNWIKPASMPDWHIVHHFRSQSQRSLSNRQLIFSEKSFNSIYLLLSVSIAAFIWNYCPIFRITLS